MSNPLEGCTLIATLRPGREPVMHVSPEEFGKMVNDRIDADPILQESVMDWEHYRAERNAKRQEAKSA